MSNELVTVRMEVPDIAPPQGNLDEIQTNLDTLLAAYTGRAYTESEIKDAKKDRAQLNTWDKQLGTAAKALKEHYLKALNEPLDRIADMREQVKQCAGAIDAQVKAVEQAEKEEKGRTLLLIYKDAIGEDLEPILTFDKLLNSKWLNKTYSLSQAERELRKAIEVCRESLRIIRTTCGQDAEACTTEYLRNLSLNDAMNEHQRREDSRAAQARAEEARKAAEMARAAAPVIISPTQEEREIRAEAAATAQASAYITNDGRLDMNAMNALAQNAAPAQQPQTSQTNPNAPYAEFIDVRFYAPTKAFGAAMRDLCAEYGITYTNAKKFYGVS
jgi:hypothetical protein